jgi:hypothetical protein
MALGKQLISASLIFASLRLAFYLDTPLSTNSSWETSVDLNHYTMLTRLIHLSRVLKLPKNVSAMPTRVQQKAAKAKQKGTRLLNQLCVRRANRHL